MVAQDTRIAAVYHLGQNAPGEWLVVYREPKPRKGRLLSYYLVDRIADDPVTHMVERIGAGPDDEGPYESSAFRGRCTCPGSQCRRHAIVCRHQEICRLIDTWREHDWCPPGAPGNDVPF